MATVDLLLAIGLVCLLVAVGMNVVTAARSGAGTALTKGRRIRSAVFTASIATAGLACIVGWFVVS